MPAKFGSSCPEGCEYKILETSSPVKIIIMDKNKNSGQTKLIGTNKAAVCNKEIQCCTNSGPVSKGQQCCADVGIE